ncbi:hypothetical protein [Bombilactobacillus thymidiniphilus]|uniref:Surface layer protein A domain-containing protein n=1 Tax=Bombilactobacillus thymidiniphilus TaxID=2923363 RepID=A0ABY4PBJ4_9LACO|nr:hypothetical protein [Bombilactobacillus thymidiniphilus]UQS83009.1 hypothetical protein MOO47_04295 [Bombilactobacillus thymidiniphilus]
MKNKKLYISIVVSLLLTLVMVENPCHDGNNVIQAQIKTSKNQRKQQYQVKKIKIGQVYYFVHRYNDEKLYIKLLDQQRYSVIILNSNPSRSFKNGDFYKIDFYTGQYFIKNNDYILNSPTNDFSSVYFTNNKKLKRKQYSFISGPEYVKVDAMNMHLKKDKYVIGLSKIEIDPSYPLFKHNNTIQGFKDSIFPNNSDEFFQQFSYVPE